MDSLGCSKVKKYKYFQEKMAAYISEILLFQLKMARLLSLSTNALYHWSHDFPRSEKFSDALYWPVSNLVCYWLLLHVIVIVLHHIGRFPILSGFVIVIACFCYCFSAYWLVSNLVCYLISPVFTLVLSIWPNPVTASLSHQARPRGIQKPPSVAAGFSWTHYIVTSQ